MLRGDDEMLIYSFSNIHILFTRVVDASNHGFQTFCSIFGLVILYTFYPFYWVQTWLKMVENEAFCSIEITCEMRWCSPNCTSLVRLTNKITVLSYRLETQMSFINTVHTFSIQTLIKCHQVKGGTRPILKMVKMSIQALLQNCCM